MSEVAELTGRVVPCITAAADEYGAQVWDTPAETAAQMAPAVRADQAVALFGLRVLDLLVRGEVSRPALREAVADVIDDRSDDAVASLRLQVKKALSADGQLAADIAALVKDAPITAGAGSQVISGSHISGNVNQIGNARDVRIGEDRSTTVHGGNHGILSTGDNAQNVQMNAEASGQGRVYQSGRDQTINER